MNRKVKLDTLLEIIPGMAFRSRDASPHGAFPVIGASAIEAGSVLSEFSKLPKLSELPTRSPAVVQGGDILMVSRATPGAAFKAALVATQSPIVATSSLYILRSKTDTLSPQYLNYFLNSDPLQRQIQALARGSTIAHISRRALAELEIPIPSQNIQKAIIDLANNIKQQNKINQRKQALKEQIITATFTNLYA